MKSGKKKANGSKTIRSGSVFTSPLEEKVIPTPQEAKQLLQFFG